MGPQDMSVLADIFTAVMDLGWVFGSRLQLKSWYERLNGKLEFMMDVV